MSRDDKTQRSLNGSPYPVVVNHGATAGTARPAGATIVIWIGSVTPTNAIDGDEWHDTSSSATGVDSIFIPPNGFSVQTGTPVVGNAVSTADWAFGYLFDQASIEAVASVFFMPTGWASFTADLWWSNAAAGSGAVRWQVFFNSIGNAASMVTGGTSDVQNVTAPGAGTSKMTTFHASGFAATAGNMVQIQIARLANDAADTLANDAALLGLVFRKAS